MHLSSDLASKAFVMLTEVPVFIFLLLEIGLVVSFAYGALRYAWKAHQI